MEDENILSVFEPASKDVPVYMFALFVLSVVIASVLFGYYMRLKEFVTLVNKIPGPDQHPIVSIVVPLINAFCNRHLTNSVFFFQTLWAYTHLYGYKEGIWRFWSFYRPIIIVSKPETVEDVLSSNVLINKSAEYYFIRPWLKTGLVTSSGKKWRSRRKLITSAFHFRILYEFLPVFEEQSRVLVSKLHFLQNTVIDIVPVVTLCTLDIICETAMGKSIGAQNNAYSPYVKGLHKVCEAFIYRMTHPWLWFDRSFYKTEYGKKYMEHIEEMSSFVQNVIKERKHEMLNDKQSTLIEEFESESDGYYGRKKKKAFLDLLLYHHIVHNSLNLNDIEEEVDSFMFAGHDTTAVGISWVLYLLGLYPEVQQKVQEEIRSIFGDDITRPVTDEDLKEMKYLECVLKETMRLYPSAPFVARKVQEDTVIDGHAVPKKSTCLVFIYMLHRRADIFPNPEIFDPDRFLPENMSGRHPFAYVPFSAGPRNCIGQKFALMEEKVLVTNILREFSITSLDQRDTLHLTMEMVLRSRHGLRLKFTPKYPDKLRVDTSGSTN